MPKKILVVDDHEPTRRSMSVILKRQGFEVITAANGHEGLKRAQTENPNLVITDNIMPIMTGLTMLRKMGECEATQSIPAILCTSVQTTAIESCIARGLVSGLIVKPADQADILAEVNRVLGL